MMMKGYRLLLCFLMPYTQAQHVDYKSLCLTQHRDEFVSRYYLEVGQLSGQNRGSVQFENAAFVIFLNVVEIFIFRNTLFCQAHTERSFSVVPGAIAAATNVHEYLATYETNACVVHTTRQYAMEQV